MSLSVMIKIIKGKYNVGDAYTNQSFMDEVKTKYKEWVEETKAKGKNPISGVNKIIALKIQIDTLQQLLQKAQKQSTSTDNDKNKEKKPKKAKEWMTKKLNDGEALTKKVNGKAYHWCKGNGSHKPKWVIHKLKQCNGLKK